MRIMTRATYRRTPLGKRADAPQRIEATWTEIPDGEIREAIYLAMADGLDGEKGMAVRAAWDEIRKAYQ